MKLADQIVAQLQDAGVRRIYGIVGDSLNPNAAQLVMLLVLPVWRVCRRVAG